MPDVEGGTDASFKCKIKILLQSHPTTLHRPPARPLVSVDPFWGPGWAASRADDAEEMCKSVHIPAPIRQVRKARPPPGNPFSRFKMTGLGFRVLAIPVWKIAQNLARTLEVAVQ